MKVFVKNKENNEIIQIYDNVIYYDEYSIEYYNNGYRAKIYIYTDFEYIDNKEFNDEDVFKTLESEAEDE